MSGRRLVCVLVLLGLMIVFVNGEESIPPGCSIHTEVKYGYWRGWSTQLQCRGAGLTAFPKIPKKIRMADFRDNLIAHTTPEDWEQIKKLDEVYLKGNPFHCDCNLKWLKIQIDKSYERPRGTYILEADEIKCATPLKMYNKAIKSASGLCYINKCKNANPPCLAEQRCVPVGSNSSKVECFCDNGFRYMYNEDNEKCEDRNECFDLSLPCAGNQTCVNKNGTWDCICDEGYNKTSLGCQDINECFTGAHKCNTSTTKCHNTDGGHTCKCLEGFKKKQDKCVDIDECTNGAHKCNVTTSKCKNKNGGYDCPCREGYKMKNDKCVDLDECKLQKHNCTKMSYCQNTAGSFRCICPSGYKRNRDGRSCHKRSNPSSGASVGTIVAAVGLPVAFLSVLITILARKRWLRKPGLEGQKGSEEVTDIKDAVLVLQNESTAGGNVENITCQK